MQPTQKTTSKQRYNHLTQGDRDRIQALLDACVKPAEIARILGREKSTVGREIQRNKRSRGDIPAVNTSQYQASAADQKAYVRRLYATYQGKKIQECAELREYIIRGLKKHWNPDEIAGAMKETGQPFYASKSTIYEWLYSEWGQAYTVHLASKQYKPKQRHPTPARHMIPNRASITSRPAAATDRSEYGHYEGDGIVSAKRTGSTAALAVTVERMSRFIAARKVANLRPVVFNDALKSIQARVVPMLSLTLDNGIENRQHAKLGIPTFFCDPYSSWQKGGVENANRMIRRYLPKGTDMATVSPQRLRSIIARINNKPRKILGYKSALQVMCEQGLLRKNGLSVNNAKVALGG
jgi:IS30 family transposase